MKKYKVNILLDNFDLKALYYNIADALKSSYLLAFDSTFFSNIHI